MTYFLTFTLGAHENASAGRWVNLYSDLKSIPDLVLNFFHEGNQYSVSFSGLMATHSETTMGKTHVWTYKIARTRRGNAMDLIGLDAKELKRFTT